MDENQIPSNELQSTDATVFFSTGDLMKDITGEIRPTPEEDPLDTATELPSLFPEDSLPKKEVPALPLEPATVVARPKKKKKHIVWPILRCLGKLILGLVLAAAVLAAGLVGYLTVTEYTPAYAELPLRGSNDVQGKVTLQQPLRLLSFNTGYGALGEDADFFMDGGTGVNPDSQETVEGNMIGIEGILNRTKADFIFLQEVDTDSSRTFRMNQWLQYEFDLDKEYETRYALNYSCDYVPYPLHERMGRVNSGIATFSSYDITSATRYSLPCPFQWPVRAANIKRCMLVTRIPLEEREQELVLINFHLEAYDDGEGKVAQFQQLLSFMEAEFAKGNYVIAGGDFNQTFPDAVDTFPIQNEELWMPGLLEELPENWKYAYDDSVPTCRLLNEPYDPKSENTQYYVIDGFIVSPNVKVDKVETLDEDFLYSDHNPVVLDIHLIDPLANEEEVPEE